MTTEIQHEIAMDVYTLDPSKLAVIFPAKVHNRIKDICDATGANKSDVARAAILAGIDQLDLAVTENGMLNLKGWIAALNGKVK
tara:strand:- start:10958 stop:11209 length:252 start_codon:yes stop_codon:yes gene_type:complete